MTPLPPYQIRILPALQKIQEQHGYLKREELEQFARIADLPLHRIHSVASFYPHFRTTPPPVVTLRVCRDMSCHMSGSAAMRAELERTLPEGVRVEGVSCLGRCDRAPAAFLAVHTDSGGHDDELGYHGRTAAQLSRLVAMLLQPPANASAGDRTLMQPDWDEELSCPTGDWLIDPYRTTVGASPGATPTPYAVVRRVAAAQTRAIDVAAATLRETARWTHERAKRFAMAVHSGGSWQSDDQQVDEAVCSWQTASGWAADATMANWSDPFLAELDSAHADLRGMGGAGIPATQKWRDVRDAIRTACERKEDSRGFIVVNGDESEPGTFKDRELLLRTPHLVVEAVIVAGLLTGATEGFIYIRHEYHEQIEACRAEIRRAEELGVCGDAPAAVDLLGRPFRVSVFVSPGGYVCGEQSALIEAMSDRRSEPRNMPPKLETNGLDDQPTLVSNVETFAWVPFILLNGGKKYAELGVNGWRGRRFFSVSGDVNRPGVYEVPMGLTLRELITGPTYCQGMKDGRALKAIAPSGPSGGFLPARLTASSGLPRKHTENKAWLELAARRGFDPKAQELDILDLELELNLFRSLSPTQALGAGIVVYAEGRDMVDQAVNAIEFYRAESCGKCVPCRIGSQKMAALGARLLAGKVSHAAWKHDLQPTVNELGKVMELSSICGLGRSVPVPLRTAAEFFKADMDRHLPGSPGNVVPATIMGVAPGMADIPAGRPAAGGAVSAADRPSPATIMGVVPKELR